MRRTDGPGEGSPAVRGAGLPRPAIATRVLAAMLLATLAVGRADDAAVHWRIGSTPPVVEVTGIRADELAALRARSPDDAAWAARFAVYAEQPGARSVPPMAGRWSVDGSVIRFEPRFPLARGVRYRAEFRPGAGPPVVATYSLPEDETPPTTVVRQIYPSAATLPENQLKFYLEFSAPMSRGSIYDHLHLHEVGGRAVELPFLELDEELWDPTMTRLTLLIDPGRIKRGVKPLEDIGPVFESGRRYELTLDAACRDAAGRPLQRAFSKAFAIGPADRTPPDPARWKIRPPVAGSRAALVVDFDEPMDEALARRLIRVAPGSDGAVALAGTITLEQHEQCWRFVPEQPWSAGPHRLTVAPTIEDLAGNNIGKTFDVDLASGAARRVAASAVNVPFEIK